MGVKEEIKKRPINQYNFKKSQAKREKKQIESHGLINEHKLTYYAGITRQFAGNLDKGKGSFDSHVPLIYDGTSTWGKGAENESWGFFLKASSENMDC